MNARSRLFSSILCTAVWVLPSALTTTAQESESSEAKTAVDPAVPADELELMVKWRTRAELEIEARAWLEVLKEKVKEISNRQIAVKRKNLQIAKVEEMADAAEAAKDAAEEAKKAVEKARETADTKAAEEAAEKGKQAEKKAREAKKAAEEAQQAEKKTEESEDVRKAEEEALKKAEEKATEEAEEKAATSTTTDTPDEAPPKPPTSEDAKAPTVDEEAVKDTGKLGDTAEAAKKSAESKAQVKDALLDDINELRTQRTALIRRLNIVLDELEAKGGEVEEYRKYVTAVSGITLDVSDASATFSTIKGWLTSPEGGLRLAINLGKFAGVLLGFWILSLLLGRMTDKAARASRRTSELLRKFLSGTVRRAVMIVGIIVGLAFLEINISPLVAAIGGAAFVIAFALQGTLGNFASGVLILAYRPFDVGDVIEAGGVSGKVESMNLVSTHIKTFDNKLMIVPNNQIWGNVITNATGTDQRRVDMVFGIGYEDDIDKAQEILEDIVTQHPLVLDEPAPVIKVHELADSSVNFVCRPWVKTVDYWTVYWDVTRAVKQEFDRQGVSIPFPQTDIHVHQSSPATPAPARTA